MPSKKERNADPEEKSGTITEASQEQVEFGPPQMPSSASALQSEKFGDEKVDTMETHDKADHNADENPAIEDAHSTLAWNLGDAPIMTSETDLRPVPSEDLTQEIKLLLRTILMHFSDGILIEIFHLCFQP